MKYGLVNGHRREAQRGLSAHCPVCASPLVAKCGERRVRHWAHRGRRSCDHWWEPETEWHRAWKNHFPDVWQEVIHRAGDGEKHIADVRTEHGQVIEVQHSYLRPEERRAREAFYRSMVWVVNGLRRKRDSSQFEKALNSLRVIRGAPLVLMVPSDECAILKEWADSRVPVYLDFGATNILEELLCFGAPVLWRVYPKSPKGAALVAPVYRTNFIESHRTGAAVRGMDYSKVVERERKSALARHFVLPRLLRPRRRRRF